MEDRDPPRASPADAPLHGVLDPQALARDWITLWQSELTAAAADREAQETWQALAALWAGAAGAMVPMLPGGWPHEPARAAAPPRAAPVAAAPDARDAEIRRLAERVAELERRLAGLERGPG